MKRYYEKPMSRLIALCMEESIAASTSPELPPVDTEEETEFPQHVFNTPRDLPDAPPSDLQETQEAGQ